MKFKDGGEFVRSLYENMDCEYFDRNRRVSIETQILIRRFDEAVAELKAALANAEAALKAKENDDA